MFFRFGTPIGNRSAWPIQSCTHTTGAHLYCLPYSFWQVCAIPPGRAHNSQDCVLIRPFDSLKMIWNEKNTSLRCVFTFGTPIGNRTLVSAVRGRRLEPLDHEGKSLLLCDNSIILCSTQAKICIFSQKNCFWRSTTVLFGDYDEKILNSVLIFGYWYYKIHLY